MNNQPEEVIRLTAAPTTTTDVDGLVADAARANRLLPEEVWEATHPGGHRMSLDSTAVRATQARRLVYLALRMNGFSLPWIGRTMGRDHTTVLYHLNLATPVERTAAEQLALKWAGRRAA